MGYKYNTEKNVKVAATNKVITFCLHNFVYKEYLTLNPYCNI
jgi:hypothetical protein